MTNIFLLMYCNEYVFDYPNNFGATGKWKSRIDGRTFNNREAAWADFQSERHKYKTLSEIEDAVYGPYVMCECCNQKRRVKACHS